MVGNRVVPVSVETSLLLDLAPHGGCLSRCITAPAGGLLHRRFTLTLHKAGRFAFCGPIPSVYTLPGVTRNAALWCADFPRTHRARVHPTDLDSHYTVNLFEMCKYKSKCHLACFANMHCGEIHIRSILVHYSQFVRENHHNRHE